MTETVRLRLVFEDRHMLSKTKKKEGLKRCWVLLKPQHNTISDLVAYLLYTFGLHRTCPNGIILFMDDFVLPPFESTCILKDKDVICVKRKGSLSTDYKHAMLTSPHEHQYVELPKLLTNEKFQEETRAYEIESPEDDNDQCEDATQEESESDDVVSKKRKAPKKLRDTRQKKIKLSSTEKLAVISDANGSLQDCVINRQLSLVKKDNDKSSILSSQQDKSSIHTLDTSRRSNKTSGSKPTETRLCQPQDDGKGNIDVSNPAGETKKLPSRSARRKKAKRRWLREQVTLEKKKLDESTVLEKDVQQSPVNVSDCITSNLDQSTVLEKDVQQSPVKVSDCITSNVNQESDGESEAEDDVVPIEIRPGHIRFTSLRKDQGVPQNQLPVETFHWNGITSKKKGQKWGTEKVSVHKRDDHRLSSQECPHVPNAEGKHAYNPIDFEELTPYTNLPKEGDVIAYRLIELSSVWTPEISSYRVGKVSQCYPETMRIRLVPVAEYPCNFEKRIDEEACSLPSDPSPYGEDGSLEIDYSSLVDVRMVKHADVDSANIAAAGEASVDETKATNGRIDEELVDDRTAVEGDKPHNKQDVHSPAQGKENGQVNVWDEINEALTAKKSQLSQKHGWNKETSGNRSWSHRVRCSALGPTMARLRSQNELSETNQQ
ncbi:hypothetical protein L6164_025199 [Bauhinia variegata]|uniref:Uncharacterized protein n=1 Tax=Bauhinia variegata TaxID=167791 RepID=A0ACB9M167_BAUVA|nr:hypothetical protein L6164_025199 [Bauhinia variegata]